MNSNTKKFSIIIPIYNTGKYLQSAINSLVNQTLDFNDNVEIILVNDGSTDKSEQICRKIIQNYPDNIKYIYKENGGVASARNVGIQVAEGEWLGFLDPDDTYSLNTLSELQNGILRWPNIKLFSIPMFTFEREKNLID
jgi:glycosyltransferase involved in cell wall biosynthesis